MIYEKTQFADFEQQEFAFLKVDQREHTLTITLNRPKKKNALHPVMVNELAFALYYARFTPDIWVVILEAAGDVFCSGADLKAMMGDLGEFHSTIPEPNGEVLLGSLFRDIHKPIIAVVRGDVHAGGILLLTGCHYIIARNDIKLALPEVKRGLFPFQVMANLLEILPARRVLDWCIRGYALNAEQAREAGLITHVTIAEKVQECLEELLAEITTNSPKAIQLGLEAYAHIRSREKHHEYLRNMFLQALQTEDAMEGMMAFREKRKPVWKGI